MKAGGVQVLADLFNCDPGLLNDRAVVEAALSVAAHAAGATIVRHDVHQFEPHGITGIAILAESHLTIHTWPEHAYATLDIFTCGETATPERAVDAVADILKPTTITRCSFHRGEEALTPVVGGTPR